jgi:hypothetical protein
MNTGSTKGEMIGDNCRTQVLERQNRILRYVGLTLTVFSGFLLMAQTSPDASKFDGLEKPAESTELEQKFLRAEIRMIRDMLPSQDGMECGSIQGLSDDNQRVAVRVPVITDELPEEQERRREILLRKANVTARSIILEFMPRLQVKDVEIEFVDFDAGGLKAAATFRDGGIQFP